MKQDPLLQGTERIDVLNVLRSSTDLRRDPLELFFAQPHQPHQRWPETPTSSRDPIRRNFQQRIITSCSGDGCQCRMGEQSSNVDVQAMTVHALEQRDSKQRMPTEL